MNNYGQPSAAEFLDAQPTGFVFSAREPLQLEPISDQPKPKRDIFDDVADERSSEMPAYAIGLLGLVFVVFLTAWLIRRYREAVRFYWESAKRMLLAFGSRIPSVIAALLFLLSISLAPYRAPAERLFTPARIFRPIYYPPSEGEYRLDITLLGAQWAAIGIIAFGLHRLRSTPPK